MDYEQARFNMIEQQVRTWEVFDRRILDLLSEIHREDFIPEPYKKLALADVNLPLSHGQFTMTPKVEARLLQSLEISEDDRILEIGIGCGFLTALLGRLGGEVYSIDCFPEFTEQARQKLTVKNIRNVTLLTGNAADGLPEYAPYDVIVVTGSVPAANQVLERQLAVGGRMFVVIGESPAMDATLITRAGDNAWSREVLFETDIPPLTGTKRVADFRF